jgi:site-specific recombinase XerD
METSRKQEQKHRQDHPDTLIDYVYDYLDHLRGLGRRPRTLAKRKGDLLTLLDFLVERGRRRIQEIRPADLDAYPGWLRQHDYKPQSVAGMITGARGWFAWFIERRILFENPARQLRAGSVERGLGLVLTETQVLQLLLEPDCHTASGQRDRAIIEVLYATGVRLGECTALRLADVDLDEEVIKVFGKNSKERLIPLGSTTAAVLRVYIKKTRPKLNRRRQQHRALWLSRVGAPLGPQSIRLAVQRHARAAGLPKATDTHALRRTCATHLLRRGAHPAMVAQILGHANLQTLSAYLRIAITDLKKAHARTGPGQ